MDGQGAHIPALMVRTVATHEAGSWAEHSPHLFPFIPSVRSSLLPLYPFYGGAKGGSVWGQVLGVLETRPSSHRGCRRGKAGLGLSDSSWCLGGRRNHGYKGVPAPGQRCPGPRTARRALRRTEALLCSICRFPRCPYAHDGQVQATKGNSWGQKWPGRGVGLDQAELNGLQILRLQT